MSTIDHRFEEFFHEAEPRLRRALVAAYGVERGSEATSEALSYAWQHRTEVLAMENPIGYLYRVGQSRSRLPLRRTVFPPPRHDGTPLVEPELPNALRRLSKRQRVAVVLVYGFEWKLSEVSELLGIAPTTVQNHLERGMANLRKHLEVNDG